MRLPKWGKIAQSFDSACIKDLKGELNRELEKLNLKTKLKPGRKVAITAGSRGITNIDTILREVAAYLKSIGFRPYIIAAMGSHGGGTVEGQREILESIGITEKTVQAPIEFCAESVEIGKTVEGIPVYVNPKALKAESLIVINRIKPHTSFDSDIESGLLKMMAVGLGNPKGAQFVHSNGTKGMTKYLPKIAEKLLAVLPVVGCIGIVENAYHDTHTIKGIEPDNLYENEKELLVLAKSLMPKIPFDEVDLLIVDYMGKNYSGPGMDTNIINRFRVEGLPENIKPPYIKRIYVRDLSPESHGNATGIGLADFTLKRLVDKIDFQKTYLNVVTSTFLQRGMLPIISKNDKETLQWAIKSLGNIRPEDLKIVSIKNTLEIEEMKVSEKLYNLVDNIPGVKKVEDLEEISFNEEGMFN